jgi:hypothetical protein
VKAAIDLDVSASADRLVGGDKPDGDQRHAQPGFALFFSR